MISRKKNNRQNNRNNWFKRKKSFGVGIFGVGILLFMAIPLFFSSCAGLLPGMGGDEAGSGAEGSGDTREQEGAQEQQVEKEASPVTVGEVESALMQLTLQMKAVSEFEDYSRGAPGFEESLALLFLLDRGPVPEEDGVLRAVYKETGEVYHEYTRAVVDAEENYRLWRFVHTVEGESLSYEVFVDDNRIPREVRYEDPETGEKTQRPTRFDKALSQAEDSSTRAEVLRSLERQKREEMRAGLPAYYRELEIGGEETIEQADRTLEAVHLSRKLGEDFGGDLHVWYSRDVPGRIIRVRIGEDIPKVGVEKWEVKP
ncbi:MAG: hypothetical protein ACLFSA_10500 [Spirochaetaceae bacterium]